MWDWRTPEHDSAAVRRIAVHSDTDPRTVSRYLRGLRIQRGNRRRIEEAIEREGLDDGIEGYEKAKK